MYGAAGSEPSGRPYKAPREHGVGEAQRRQVTHSRSHGSRGDTEEQTHIAGSGIRPPPARTVRCNEKNCLWFSYTSWDSALSLTQWKAFPLPIPTPPTWGRPLHGTPILTLVGRNWEMDLGTATGGGKIPAPGGAHVCGGSANISSSGLHGTPRRGMSPALRLGKRGSQSYQAVKLVQNPSFQHIMRSPAWSHNPPATKLRIQSLAFLSSTWILQLLA